MKDIKSENFPDLLRGNTDALLLFLVHELGHTYGYQLIKEIGRKSEGFFRFKEGTVYPALRKLENDGLLKGEWEQTPGGQERRYYRITDKGLEALKNKLTVWESFYTAMNLILKPAQS